MRTKLFPLKTIVYYYNKLVKTNTMNYKNKINKTDLILS